MMIKQFQHKISKFTMNRIPSFLIEELYKKKKENQAFYTFLFSTIKSQPIT